MQKKLKKPVVTGWPQVELDARTFQKPLGELTNTISLKVEREGIKRLKPNFAAIDIYMMLRQALRTYDLFFFINADERRKNDPDWRVGYSAAILPLIRCLIDCLYNITSILNNPGPKGYQLRESGYKLTLAALDADETRYGGDPKWDKYIAGRRAFIHTAMTACGITMADVQAAKTWPTLSSYLHVKTKTPLTAHQEFLKRLTFGFWQEYSGMAHATFQGLMPTAIFYTPSDIPWEHRQQFEDVGIDQMISMHLARVAGVLLCTLTEVQVYFRFDGANINRRLHEIWKALIPVLEVKELYDERYAELMEKKDILP
ncbi:MAG: hypothetical protein WBE13_06740 [Candidatus Acidiferrum sp.]